MAYLFQEEKFLISPDLGTAVLVLSLSNLYLETPRCLVIGSYQEFYQFFISFFDELEIYKLLL